MRANSRTDIIGHLQLHFPPNLSFLVPGLIEDVPKSHFSEN